MRKLVTGMAVILFTLGGAGVAQAQTGDKDCKDFATLEEAKAWHKKHPEDRLDADNDGRVCEAQFPDQQPAHDDEDEDKDKDKVKVPTDIPAGL